MGENILLLDKFVDYANPDSFGSSLRRNRSMRITRLAEDIFRRYGHCRILDLGGTYHYWKIFPEDWLEKYNVTITLLNLDEIPLPPGAGKRFESVVGNACNLSQYRDNEFDLVHSNSVIEHVGSWRDMCSMASESARVGKAYYHQTPYFWFPIEPHFLCPVIHWLPLSIRAKIARRIALGNWPKADSFDAAMKAQTSAVLLDRSMMKALFGGATIEFELFCWIPKSVVAFSPPSA